MNPQVHIAASAVLLVGAAVSPFLMVERGVEQKVRAGAVIGSHGRAISATPHAVHADGLQMQGGEGRTQTLSVERMPRTRGVQDTPPATSALPVPAIEYDGSRVVPAALWSAVVDHFPPSERVNAIRVGRCENRKFDPLLVIIDVDGLPRKGQWMVGERWWGTVPDTFDGQAEQVAGIVDEHGWSPWTCAD